MKKEWVDALAEAERHGGCMAMRATLNGNEITLSGGNKAWRQAFARGYSLGETIAILKPWKRLGEGMRQ